ncbi:hypothetical protein [Streptomyces smaragdinus]|nr:hypothetical protein [Streptomyces smaragdinus]
MPHSTGAVRVPTHVYDTGRQVNVCEGGSW